MCGGTPAPAPPAPAPVAPPPAPVAATPKQPKGRRRTADSATFSRAAASGAKANAGQGTLLSAGASEGGKTLLGA